MKQTTRVNFDKKCRLDKVCGNDDLRPVMDNIYFKNGYAYVTDAHILLRANLKSISNLPQETIDALNGHCIHRNVFYDLQRMETFKVLDDGSIQSYDLDKATNTLLEDCIFNFDDKSAVRSDGKYWGASIVETFDNYYFERSKKSIDRFSFDPKVMEHLFQAIGYKGNFIFTPIENGDGYMLLVSLTAPQTEDKDITAIFCPTLFEKEDAEYIDKCRAKKPKNK